MVFKQKRPFVAAQAIIAILFIGTLSALGIDCTVNRNLDFTEDTLSIDTIPTDTSPSIMGIYHVYYGTLHNHTGLMGGTGTQEDAYQYARETAKLDFFGISEHDYGYDSITWNNIKAVANAYNEDGEFVAFWGFEWTSGMFGHVAVINSNDFCTSSDTATPTGTFTRFCAWLNTQNCVAFLNHPSYENAYGLEFNHFAGPITNKIVGMELWNKNVTFSTFFYNDGYYSDDNNKGFFDEALSRGWKIGAAGSEDNHEGTWGTKTDYRLAILADTLTRDSLFAAMLARRFYSTLDKNISLSFTINGKEMGSTIASGKKAFIIQASDGNDEIFIEAVLFDKDHNLVHSWIPGSSSIDISDSLNVQNGDYFYVKIKQEDGDEAISSPIWVSDTVTNESLESADVAPAN